MGLESGWNCHISLLNDSLGHSNIINNDNDSSAENGEHKKSKHNYSDNSGK